MTQSDLRPARLFALALAALLGLGAPVASRAQESDTKSPRRLAVTPEEEDGPEQIRERVRLYLDRHGDRAAIDPERRRALVASEYARYREERKAKRPAAIGGDQWVSLGPTNGAGRMTAIAFPANAPSTAYAGSAGGGVWKTTDGGTTWTPLTDGLSDLAVGALAVAPSDANVIYLGSGEGGYAIDFIPGIGLLKSTDGGANWTVPSTVIASKFYRISVHPTNPQELVAGTNRGGLRSTDGGNTWSTVIAPNTYGDVPDLVRDPSNASTLYATTWCVSGNCPSKVSKVLRSTDGGLTWSERSGGLPTTAGSDLFLERLSVAISPSSPSTLYAARSIGGSPTLSHIYKTTDGGGTWRDLTLGGSQDRYMADQSWYNNVIVVSPTDANVLIAGGTQYLRSTDGGTTFSTALSGAHVDCHDLQYQGSTLWVANDGGVWSSADDGRVASAHTDGLVTRQFYGLAVDSTNRNRILAGAQDNGTVQRVDSGGTTWRAVIGSDGFECGILPGSPGIAFGTIQNGRVFRTKNASTSGTPAFQEVTPPYDSGENTPFLSIVKVDPTTASTIYTGSYRVWRSRDGGSTWAPLPLTTTDGSQWTNGTRATVQAIALSKTDPLMILAARRDGPIFRSGDGGQTWISGSGLTGAIVNNVEIDPKNSGVAYAAVASTTETNLYKTTDGGFHWFPSNAGLPPFAVQVVRVDPTDSQGVFCGTDVGVFRSTDAGVTWSRFGTGLPATSVHDLQILDDGSMVRIATHGRGIWELQVTPTGNHAPSATITLPAGPVSVPLGGTVTFAGVVSDSDAGDSATGSWIFSDPAEVVPLAAPLVRTFRRSGVFPISLAARDSHGSVVAATVLVTVTEPADGCATPIVIPGQGPFPYTVRASNESATFLPTDASPFCVSGSGRNASVWFEFTPQTTGSFDISTCGASLDSVLVLATGAACGPYTAIACNDDGGVSGCEATASELTASLTAGTTYRIQVSGFNDGDVGSFPLTIRTAGSNTVPRVTGVSAAEGPPGGSVVLIAGANFADGATVAFDGVPASEVVVLGPTAISARAPMHVAGPVDVSVTTSAGTGTLARGFTYTPFTAVPCVATGTALCLNNGRFRAEAQWRVPTANQNGQAAAIPLTGDTGYFWFFSANNIELVLKVVDGRGFNNKFWVFYGALSNVEYQITVTDLVTGGVRVYTNPSGQLSSVADTAAF